MAVPVISDFPVYTGKKITGEKWNNLIQGLVSMVTTNKDCTFASLSSTQVNASYYFGDISNCTGVPSPSYSLTTGEDITQGQLVRIGPSGSVLKADSGSSSGIQGIIGIAGSSAVSGNNVLVFPNTYSAFSALVPGTIYYAGSSGALTSTQPAVYAKSVGIALNSTTLFLSPFLEAEKVMWKAKITNSASVGAGLSVGGDIQLTGSSTLRFSLGGVDTISSDSTYIKIPLLNCFTKFLVKSGSNPELVNFDTAPADGISKIYFTPTFQSNLSSSNNLVGMTLEPTVNTVSETSNTFSYFYLSNIGTSGSATVTNSFLFSFNLNPGANKMVDSGATKATPGVYDAFIKVRAGATNTTYYIGMYLSKTS